MSKAVFRFTSLESPVALTALHPDLGVLDVTEFSVFPADWWDVVHRTGAPLTCRAAAGRPVAR